MNLEKTSGQDWKSEIMALTHTPAPEIGTPCPDFELPSAQGGVVTREQFKGKNALLIMFICNHCPYVLAVEDRLLELARGLQKESVGLVAISANDSERYPEDSFEKMKSRTVEKNYPFPYLYDETQQVARSFGAVCTPDFFLYDSKMKLAYRGRLDDSWKDAAAVHSRDLALAIEALLGGRRPTTDQKSSMGCSIKWKPETFGQM